MTRIILSCLILITGCFSCVQKEERSAAAPSGTVFLASQERSIEYVDSVPVLSEDVTVFDMQPVDEPYYDTTFNTSSLVLSLSGGDSIRVYSLPDFQSSAYLSEQNGEQTLNIPEFNDVFSFRTFADSVVLDKGDQRQRYTTYFHSLPETAGDIDQEGLIGTTWDLDNSPIDRITFLGQDSCIFRMPWGDLNPNGPFSSLHPGKWNVKVVDRRMFLVIYSYYIPGPMGNVFMTYFIRSGDQESISSETFMHRSLNDPVERLASEWNKLPQPSADEVEDRLRQIRGTWISGSYPFALERRHEDEYDTILNTVHTLTLNEDGTFSEKMTGTRLLKGEKSEINREIKGKWEFNPFAYYIHLIPEQGAAVPVSIEKPDGNTLILNLVRRGFSDQRYSDQVQAVFTKQEGT